MLANRDTFQANTLLYIENLKFNTEITTVTIKIEIRRLQSIIDSYSKYQIAAICIECIGDKLSSCNVFSKCYFR